MVSLLLIPAAFAQAPAPAEDPWVQTWQEAQRLEEAKRPEAAARRVEEALLRWPQDHSLWLRAGDLRLVAGQAVRARDRYAKAAALSGGDPGSTRGLQLAEQALRPRVEAGLGLAGTAWVQHPELEGAVVGGPGVDLTLRQHVGLGLEARGGAEWGQEGAASTWVETYADAGWAGRRGGLSVLGGLVAIVDGADTPAGDGDGDGAGPGLAVGFGPGGPGNGGTSTGGQGLLATGQGGALAGGLLARWSPWGDLFVEANLARLGGGTVARLAPTWRSPAWGPLTIEPGVAAQLDLAGQQEPALLGFATLHARQGPVAARLGGQLGHEERPVILSLRSIDTHAGDIDRAAWAGLSVDLGPRTTLSAGWFGRHLVLSADELSSHTGLLSIRTCHGASS